METLCTVWNLNAAIATENSMRIFHKIKTELPYDSAVPLAYIYPKKSKSGSQWGYLNTHVHGSIIYNKICVQNLRLKFNNYAFFLYSYFLATFMFMSSCRLKPGPFVNGFHHAMGISRSHHGQLHVNLWHI